MKILERKIEYVCDMDGTVEEFLKSQGYSSRICNQLKKELGLVTVNGENVFVVANIRKGDIVRVCIREGANVITPLDKPVNIVYEDEDVAVIDKTPDIAVISTNAHYNKSLMNALANVWGDYVFHPVNRLDYGTSGLMAVAKNNLAHSILSDSIREDKDRDEKRVKREYIAVVHNFEEELVGSGDIIADIGQPSMDSMARGVVANGKYAKTHYEVIEHTNRYSIVKLILATGRTHQIRVHMAHIGHPLVGDDLYGGDKEYISRPALHSARIAFEQPITHQYIDISSDLPDDMREVVKKMI